MEFRKVLEAAIADVLKPEGFRKRGSTWHCERPQVVWVVNLQKSAWGGDRYYLNLGVYVKALGDKSRPPEVDCHVRCRAEVLGGRALVPAPPDPQEVAAMVASVALPLFKSLGDIEGVTHFVRAPVRGCFVQKSALEFLTTAFEAPPA